MSERLELSEFLDLLLDAVCAVDREGRFVYVNAAVERLFGYRPEELVGREMIQLVAPEDRERTLATAARVLGGEAVAHFENHYLHRDGHRIPIMWTARWSERHQLRIAVARDVSAKRRSERSQQAVYAISEAVHEARDLPGLIGLIHAIIEGLLPASRLALALFDESRQPLRYLFDSGDARSDAEAKLERALCEQACADGDGIRHDISVQETVAGSWLCVPLGGPRGTIGCLWLSRSAAEPGFNDADLELLRYVSHQVAAAIERKRLQESLQRMAHHDLLTGLPNRGLLHDRLGMAIARAKRTDRRCALLYIDLDGFKQINDQGGHAAGDTVLCAVAARLLLALRASDTVARIGGDEFVVLMEDLGEPCAADRLVDTVHRALSEELPGQPPLPCAASIGLALFPEHGEDADALLQHADRAMYASKRARPGFASSDCPA